MKSAAFVTLAFCCAVGGAQALRGGAGGGGGQTGSPWLDTAQELQECIAQIQSINDACPCQGAGSPRCRMLSSLAHTRRNVPMCCDMSVHVQ